MAPELQNEDGADNRANAAADRGAEPFDATREPSTKRNRWRTVLFVTIGVHVVGAIVALLYVPDWSGRSSDSADASEQSGQQDATSTETAETPPPEQPDSESAAPATPTKQPEEWNERVEAKVDEIVDDANQRNDDANRSKLAQKAAELERISSTESVEEMTPVLVDALKLGDRATAPAAAPPEGKFDSKTAQFHKVRKEVNEEGKTIYVSVMVDSAGRTVEVELDPAEGESVYETMQLIEKNPLLEKVYRNLVMPAIDKTANLRAKKVSGVNTPDAPSDSPSDDASP